MYISRTTYGGADASHLVEVLAAGQYFNISFTGSATGYQYRATTNSLIGGTYYAVGITFVSQTAPFSPVDESPYRISITGDVGPTGPTGATGATGPTESLPWEQPSGDNLVTNPMFSGGLGNGWIFTRDAAVANVSATSGSPAFYAAVLPPNTAGNTDIYNWGPDGNVRRFPIQPGESFYYSFWAMAINDTISDLRLQMRRSSGDDDTDASWATLKTLSTGGKDRNLAWAFYEGYYTPPSDGRTSGMVAFSVPTAASSSGAWYVTHIVLQRMPSVIGTFTPTLTGTTSNPTVTYTARSGWYMRVGPLVYFGVNVATSAVSGGSGEPRISGLPFTNVSSLVAMCSGRTINLPLVETVGLDKLPLSPYFYVLNGGTSIALFKMRHNSSNATYTFAEWGSNGNVYITGVYTTTTLL